MIVSPQDLCFECGYALEGLPRPYRCPECALPFDDDSIVFRPKRLWKRLMPRLVVLAYVLFQVFNHWAWLIARVGLLATIISLALLAGYIVFRGIATVRSMIERPGFVALTKADLVVKQQDQEGLTRIPYDQIAFVSIIDFTPWVQSKEIGVDEATRKSTPRGAQLTGLFDGKTEMREFKRLVTERIECFVAEDSGISSENGAPIASIKLPYEPIRINP